MAIHEAGGAMLVCSLCAGEFGFQKEMNALNDLKSNGQHYEAGLSDVDILLGATQEIEHRMQGPQRAFQLWRHDLWHGMYLLSRYRVNFSRLWPLGRGSEGKRRVDFYDDSASVQMTA